MGWISESCSKVMISEKMVDFILQVLGVVVFLASWLRSFVNVIERCIAFLPRGPDGGGGLAEFEVNASPGSADCSLVAEKIRSSLKLKSVSGLRVESAERNSEKGDEKGDEDERDSKRSGNGSSKENEDGYGGLICAVCLAEIAGKFLDSDTEEVYELPRCDHIFHKQCLDGWLDQTHSDCPLCRSSLLPASENVAVDDIQGGDNNTGLVEFRGEEFVENEQAETDAPETVPPSSLLSLGSTLWCSGPSRSPVNFGFLSSRLSQTLSRLEGFSS